MKIDIPDIGIVESQKGLKMFTRSNVIGLCEKSLRSVGDWKTIMERQIAQGKMLQLTWRVDTHLDWIWLENDVDGKPREWAVLCGLALKQVGFDPSSFMVFESIDNLLLLLVGNP